MPPERLGHLLRRTTPRPQRRGGECDVGIEDVTTDPNALGTEMGPPATRGQHLTGETGGLLDVSRGDHDRGHEVAISSSALVHEGVSRQLAGHEAALFNTEGTFCAASCHG